MLARALQHEVDHLQGVLYIDRMNSAAKAEPRGPPQAVAKGRRGQPQPQAGAARQASACQQRPSLAVAVEVSQAEPTGCRQADAPRTPTREEL